eukprot:TRINITY_DN62773_c0_g1_i1.p1 TRINITY_DN62773_c0_g1~~TRINITY_DN62773_c0_g1_i1.p1  ORF type:complete len:379 (-),score=48.83 TRINITY_DN62773_c0_g1_i1:172-1158(-)
MTSSGLPWKACEAAPREASIHAQAYDAIAHKEVLKMVEITPKYHQETDVGRPPFPYIRPGQGRFLAGGANVCPGGQYFDNPSLGNFDPEAMKPTTNRSFNKEFLDQKVGAQRAERKLRPGPVAQESGGVAPNYFRTTYGEHHAWPKPQPDATAPDSPGRGFGADAASAPGASPGRPARMSMPEAKVTLGPPFSIHGTPHRNVSARGPPAQACYQPRACGGAPSREAPDAEAERDVSVASEADTRPLSVRTYGEGTGFGVNHGALGATRTTTGLRGNTWTRDEFSDTFRTTYRDMLLTGFSTPRPRPGSASRVPPTSWDARRPRGLARP